MAVTGFEFSVQITSTSLVIFIPSKDRDEKPLDQKSAVLYVLDQLAKLYGGATAFPPGNGTYLDENNTIMRDETVVINSYSNPQDFNKSSTELRALLHWIGRTMNQKAVGFVVNGVYREIKPPYDGE
ncbi:MAG: hypothetical protein ACRC8S_06070 [Fimbriiglobus sp.]